MFFQNLGIYFWPVSEYFGLGHGIIFKPINALARLKTEQV
jgi:hypothetical protein